MSYCSKPGSVMVQDRWSQLAKALYRFYKDLLMLENYAIMTFCAFSKILKKHDKNTGFKTRGGELLLPYSQGASLPCCVLC